MTDALSRHADEIFAQCAGKELAIEQAFRALSEVDREGRAIRRALRFDKLLAETGCERVRLARRARPVPRPELFVPVALALRFANACGRRADRHRARGVASPLEEDCGQDRSRSTRKPAGRRQAGSPRSRSTASAIIRSCRCSTGPPAANGRPWTILSARRTGGTRLPRTAAWADRYGGKFEQVKKLIDDAIEAKRRSRRNRRLAAALGVVSGPRRRRLDVDRPRKSAGKARHERDEVGEVAA